MKVHSGDGPKKRGNFVISWSEKSRGAVILFGFQRTHHWTYHEMISVGNFIKSSWRSFRPKIVKTQNCRTRTVKTQGLVVHPSWQTGGNQETIAELQSKASGLFYPGKSEDRWQLGGKKGAKKACMAIWGGLEVLGASKRILFVTEIGFAEMFGCVALSFPSCSFGRWLWLLQPVARCTLTPHGFLTPFQMDSEEDASVKPRVLTVLNHETEAKDLNLQDLNLQMARFEGILLEVQTSITSQSVVLQDLHSQISKGSAPRSPAISLAVASQPISSRSILKKQVRTEDEADVIPLPMEMPQNLPILPGEVKMTRCLEDIFNQPWSFSPFFSELEVLQKGIFCKKIDWLVSFD